MGNYQYYCTQNDIIFRDSGGTVPGTYSTGPDACVLIPTQSGVFRHTIAQSQVEPDPGLACLLSELRSMIYLLEYSVKPVGLTSEPPPIEYFISMARPLVIRVGFKRVFLKSGEITMAYNK